MSIRIGIGKKSAPYIPPVPHVFTLGETYGGGIVLWIAPDGLSALIAADVLLTTREWGCVGVLLGGTSLAIGQGQNNTNIIMAACAEINIAVRICDTYTGGGFSNWFLPSTSEMELIYPRRLSFANLIAANYWASSEYNLDWAYYHRPLTNYTDVTGKNASNPFLPFRIAGQFD